MLRLLKMVERVAPTRSRVLISGENGTGKELVARLLHIGSPRVHSNFVAVNCAAIPAELIESELFGYEKGAFTGAAKLRKGKFEQAEGGTLFLDEIGDMSLSAQAKVLRVLQEKKISRVGGESDISVDVRIIAATNKDLRDEISRGTFREDLYHRLSVIELYVPPLRERREDISLLSAHFLRLICHENQQPLPVITPEALALLETHEWRGNIRELSNCLERLTILSDNPTCITATDVTTLVLSPNFND